MKLGDFCPTCEEPEKPWCLSVRSISPATRGFAISRQQCLYRFTTPAALQLKRDVWGSGAKCCVPCITFFVGWCLCGAISQTGLWHRLWTSSAP